MQLLKAFHSLDRNRDQLLQISDLCHAIDALVCAGWWTLPDDMTSIQKASTMMTLVGFADDATIGIDDFFQIHEIREHSGKEIVQLAVDYWENVVYSNENQENTLYPSASENKFLFAWDILVCLFSLMTMITVPLSLGWDGLSKMLMTLCLCMDIVFMFSTVVDLLMGDCCKCGWIVDALTSIPFDFILGVSSLFQVIPCYIVVTVLILKMM